MAEEPGRTHRSEPHGPRRELPTHAVAARQPECRGKLHAARQRARDRPSAPAPWTRFRIIGLIALLILASIFGTL